MTTPREVQDMIEQTQGDEELVIAPNPSTTEEDDRLRVGRPGGRRMMTLIGVALDESGSMGQHDREGGDKRSSAIFAFNEYLRSQQAVTVDDCLMTLIKFNERARVMQPPMPVGLIPALTDATYHPGGGTALFDAIAYTVAEMEQMPADRYVLVLLTDGEERDSRETTREQVTEMIRSKEALGNWTFTYLSASPDAFTAAHSYGFLTGNIAQYDNNARGVSAGIRSLANSTTSYRHESALRSQSFYRVGDQTPPPDDTPSGGGGS